MSFIFGEPAIENPGCLIICPPAMSLFHQIRKKLEETPHAQVHVLRSVQQKLVPAMAFGVYNQITMKQLAGAGGGITPEEVLLGLHAYEYKRHVLSTQACGVIAFINPHGYKPEVILASIEEVWKDSTKPGWAVEFLCGDMSKIWEHFFLQDLEQMKRKAQLLASMGT